MVFWKRIIGTLITAVMLSVMVTPCIAAEQDTVIFLEKAKELTKKNARVLQTMEFTKKKLDAESDVAYDTYMTYNLQKDINDYVYNIGQLYEQLDAHPEQADQIMVKIQYYESIVSGLKANKPDKATLKPFYLQWRALDDAYRDMPNTIENIEKSLDLTVEILYFTLLDMQSTIEIQNINLSNLGKQLRIERLKKELGLSNVENENILVTQYTSLRNMINELKGNYKLLCLQLNDMMGRELEAPLQLVDEEVLPVKTLYAKDEAYEEAVKNSLEISQKEREIDNSDEDMSNEKNGDQREILRNQKKIAQNELRELEVTIKGKISSLIDQLEASYSTWETAVRTKEQAALSHEFNKVKFKLGLIPKLQMDFSEAAYLDAVYSEKQAARAWQIINRKVALAKEGIFEQT
jgi:hypothetical protein